MDTVRRHISVERRAGHVEVTGMAADEISEALTYWDDIRRRENAAAAGMRDGLTAMRTPPLLSDERQRAAERVAARRSALLATPIFTYTTLAELKGQKESSVRAWWQRNRGQVLKVEHEGRAYLPAFQFDDAGELRPEFAQVNVILKSTDALSEWSRWSWWYARTSYLSGESPIDAVTRDLQRVKTAAQRQSAHNHA